MSAQVAFTRVIDRSDSQSTFAESVGIGPLWDPASNIACWSWGRDFAYLLQVWRTTIPICLADVVAVGLSIALSTTVFQMVGGVPTSLSWVHLACFCLAVCGGCAMSGLYPATGLNSATELRLLSRIVATVTALCMAYDLIHGGENSFLMLWPMCGVLMIALIPFARAFIRKIVCRYDWWGLRTVVIGADQSGIEILRYMNRNPAMGFKPVAMVDRYRPELMLHNEELPTGGICSLEDTPKISSRRHAYCGIFVGTEFPPEERTKLVDTLTSVFPQLYITTDSADTGRQWTGALDLGNARLLRVTEHLLMPGARWIKRAIDVTAVVLAAPLILPIVGFLALLVKITSPGPAFYQSSRVGRNGKTIGIWKLRTMVPNADRLLKEYLAENPDLQRDWERLHKLPKDPRVTIIGKFLRKASLDELPQLWNVFTGDMSLVGPRPLPPAQVSKYQSIYPLYIRVTPGITGLWQVNGRSSTSHEARVSYDAEYVRNWSVCLDLYILARTIRAVATGEGAC